MESVSNWVTVLATDLKLATLSALEAVVDCVLVGRLDCLTIGFSTGRSATFASSRLSLLATLSVLESGLPRMSLRDISSVGFLSLSNISTLAWACLMMVSISKSLSSKSCSDLWSSPNSDIVSADSESWLSWPSSISERTSSCCFAFFSLISASLQACSIISKDLSEL